MAKSIQERVRIAQAAADKTRAAVDYKAGEPARRSRAGKIAAEVRHENRLDAVLSGASEPRTKAEWDARNRMDFDNDDAWGDDL